MTGCDGRIDRVLQDLPAAAPDPRRATQVRARCHAALARQPGCRTPEDSRRPAIRLGERVALAGLSLAYLIVVVRQALQ